MRFFGVGRRRGTLALKGIERMRFALGVDHDLSAFHRRFRWDPLIGPVIRRKPWLRPRRRPEPFEALAWAVCEQLIESGRAAGIQRRIVWRHGRRSACGTLRAPPSAAWLAGRSPAELDACGLAPKRSIALIRAAREVASGRADLSQHEPAWRRLRAIPNIGNWTLEMLAVAGQGRDDQLPRSTWPTSSSLAWRRAWAAARPRTRCASSSSRTASTRRWPAATRFRLRALKVAHARWVIRVAIERPR